MFHSETDQADLLMDRLADLVKNDKLEEFVDAFHAAALDWGGEWPASDSSIKYRLRQLDAASQGQVNARLEDRLRESFPDYPQLPTSLFQVVSAYPQLLQGADGLNLILECLSVTGQWWMDDVGSELLVLLAHAKPVRTDVIAAYRRHAAGGHLTDDEPREFLRALGGPVLNPGEPWSDTALAFLETAESSWHDVIAHAGTATSGKASAGWTKRAGELIAELGDARARETIASWLQRVGEPRTIEVWTGVDDSHVNELFDPYNASYLRGLIWMLGMVPTDGETLGLLARLIEVTQRKIPGVGVRSQLTTNAAIQALSTIDDPRAVGVIARLAASVKAKATLKLLNAALDSRAKAQGISREEIEELAVPSCGLTKVGAATQRLGEAEWEITVGSNGVKLVWRNASGKTVKSPPASVKRDHAEQVKQLKARVKDITTMVSAQTERLDRQILARRQWRCADWRERYLDHPLMGTIARRLIWVVDGTAVAYVDGDLRDVDGVVVKPPADAAVTVWHPIGRDVDEVLAWRETLERHGVVQPFKQAHREVYLLTAAEQNTRIYSNRFAAHILKQHQFNALAKARGWDNQLRLIFDDAYKPATKHLPQWGLRAEFQVEGVGDHTDTNETGTYLRLATDHMRFYRECAPESLVHTEAGGDCQSATDGSDNRGPLRLADIPALVLSEVLRDVDLFVGVSSVGNDPEWADGGPEGRFRDYWHSYSFGDLEATAVTRRELLERLVPRLAIADRATVDGRFLRVRGDLRTYKIHLGSGNILMEPNNAYLCIVAHQAGAGADGNVLLPFDGDPVLSLILSKAMLLADDTAITDPTITSQITQ